MVDFIKRHGLDMVSGVHSYASRGWRVHGNFGFSDLIFRICQCCIFVLQESLFTDGGRHSELVAIRDMLDTGGREMPGSVFSVAAALLTFLASLSEPVIPVLLHQRCIDASNNAVLCKQVTIIIVCSSTMLVG